MIERLTAETSIWKVPARTASATILTLEARFDVSAASPPLSRAANPES